MIINFYIFRTSPKKKPQDDLRRVGFFIGLARPQAPGQLPGKIIPKAKAGKLQVTESHSPSLSRARDASSAGITTKKFIESRE
jgi:hypothetical protein